MPTVRVLVKGKVQGVFFRASAKEMAESIGITGWVRNRDNGDVEVMATGNDGQLEQFIAWCKKGPERAIVTDVKVIREQEASFNGFVVMRRQADL